MDVCMFALMFGHHWPADVNTFSGATPYYNGHCSMSLESTYISAIINVNLAFAMP